MMKLNLYTRIFYALMLLSLSTVVMAQSFTVENEQAPNGSATVAVDWNLVVGGGLEGIQVDVTFDDSILTPVLDGGGPAVLNCFTSVDAAVPEACNQINPSTIRISISNFPGTPLASDANGTITFDVAGGTADVTTPITVAIFGEEPVGTGTVLNDGGVEFIAGPPAVLEVTPPSIDFGSGISPTTLGPETVTIANTGAAGAPDVNVSNLDFSGADAAQFSIVGGTCVGTSFAVSAGGQCTVDIELAVNAVATFSATFDVFADVADGAVVLTGEGTAGPVASFAIDPATAAFGTVDLGDMPQSIVHTVTNDGDAGSTLELNDLSYAGDAEFSIATDCPATLAQGATCTVTVTFDAAANGPYTGTVTAVTNVGTFEVPVTGEADSVPVLAVNPDFGAVDLGSGPAGTIIDFGPGSFTNTGSADGDVTCGLSGADAGLFVASATQGGPALSFPVTIPANDSVDFFLSCRLPDDAMQGDTFTADLTCTSPDDANFDGVHNLSCGVQEFQFIPVPTMQPWALVLFSMLMLIAGGIGIRFFRAS
jgi:hypothetical protein